MPTFRVHIVRIVKEQDYVDIEAESKERAEEIAQDEEYPEINNWDHVETLDLNVKATIKV